MTLSRTGRWVETNKSSDTKLDLDRGPLAGVGRALFIDKAQTLYIER